MKHIFTCLILMIALLSSCGGVERSEAETADVTAAQMEGREEARRFLNRPWSDTLELQSQLMASRAKKSKYEMRNQPEMAQAYDSAFISTLRTVRPELAKELEKAGNK